MRRTTLILTMLILVALAVGCVPPPPLPPATPGLGAAAAGPAASTPLPQAKSTAAPQPGSVAAGANDLAGTNWNLTTLGGQQPVAGTSVTLNFGADGVASGSDGCNDYSTTYTAGEGAIKFKQPIAVTMKACPNPIMNQAAAYLAALGKTTGYRASGGELTLLDAGAKPLAEFMAQNTGLAGTSWQVVSYNNGKQAVVSVINGTTLTANFDEKGMLAGNAGCNDYNASYKTDGQKIAIGPAASTRKMCAEPQGVMEQEAAYLSAIQTAATYRIDGQKLELRTADGALAAQFTAQSTGLAGTSWQVLGYNNGKQAVVSVINGTTLTANFDEKGMLAGNAGCNDYNASYKTDGQKIAIGPAASTQKFCGQPQGVMEQEAAYLSAIQTAATYRIDGQKLELRTADGALAADFVKAGPIAAATPVEPTPELQPSQIRLDTQGLPYSWQAVSVPTMPYDASQPPGPKGLPQHIEVLFGVSDPAQRQPGSPIMYIIPVDAYRQMYDDAGNPGVSKMIDQIFKYTYVLPNPAPASLPALPYEELTGTNDLAVQAGRAATSDTSASKSGYRFVGRWAQDANPVTNQGLRYVYQGFTNDGRYLVSFFYPVTTPKLPASAAQVPADQMAQFQADPAASIKQSAAMLNALAPTDWDPDLTTLDALVGSLQITGMTPSGLLDQAWTWVDVEPGDGVKPMTDKSRTYRVTFDGRGALTYQADCNTGSGTFTYSGGAVGSLRSELGPATLAECNDAGQGQQFVNGLMAAQNFQVRPGGSTLGLILPAGGGTLILSNTGK